MSKTQRTITIGMVLVILFSLAFQAVSTYQETILTTISWFSPSGGNPPNITYYEQVSGHDLMVNSTELNPTRNDSFVRFNVTHIDEDLGDYHTTYICKSSNFNETDYCIDGEWCNYTPQDVVSHQWCDSSIEGLAAQEYNYSAFVLDSADVYSAGVNGTFYVNHPPIVYNAYITPTIAYTDDLLTCNINWTDVDSDNVTSDYTTWFDNGVEIDGEIEISYNCSKLGCDKGNSITCQFSPIDEHGYESIQG